MCVYIYKLNTLVGTVWKYITVSERKSWFESWFFYHLLAVFPWKIT